MKSTSSVLQIYAANGSELGEMLLDPAFERTATRSLSESSFILIQQLNLGSDSKEGFYAVTEVVDAL